MIKILISLLIAFSPLQKYDLVEVEWVDIVSTDGGWRSEDELNEWNEFTCDTVKQVGFVVSDNDSYLTLTDSYFKCDSSTLGYCIRIPKDAIIKIDKK